MWKRLDSGASIHYVDKSRFGYFDFRQNFLKHYRIGAILLRILCRIQIWAKKVGLPTGQMMCNFSVNFNSKICPNGKPILLTHIWILHKILGRITQILERIKKFYLKSKYPNRALLWSKKMKYVKVHSIDRVAISTRFGYFDFR